MEGQPVSRVLVDNGATMNILPVSMMKKLSKTNNDLVPMEIFVYGFSGNATRTRGVLSLKLKVGSKTQIISFFVVDTSSNYNVLLGRD